MTTTIHIPATADNAPAAPALPNPDNTVARIVRGSAADDIIHGSSDDDVIYGEGGNDRIQDTQGINLLLGGDGDDLIIGSGTLGGGRGNDQLAGTGTGGTNVYLFDVGDGRDTLITKGGTLLFGDAVTPDSVALLRAGDDLVFNIAPGDEMRVHDWYKDAARQLSKVQFSDGGFWDASDIATMDVSILGTAADDVLMGGPENNLIHGGPGNDYLFDNAGDNILYGGNGDDNLMGRGVFDGGDGDDTLMAVGDASNNVYFYDLGDGRDTLYAHDESGVMTAQGTVALGESLDGGKLWLQRDGDDLAMRVIGSTQGVTIKDWYLGSQYQVAHFLGGDDRVLDNSRVDALVQAMAQHAVPTSGDTAVPALMPDALRPALATAWQ